MSELCKNTSIRQGPFGIKSCGLMKIQLNLLATISKCVLGEKGRRVRRKGECEIILLLNMQKICDASGFVRLPVEHKML